MPWNNKCQWGHPDNFNNESAKSAVENADFSKSVYVNISEEEQNTKAAFTYYEVSGYRICVVGHVHKKNNMWTEPGNCYIPGWGTKAQPWDMRTPSDATEVIGSLNTGGSFPFENRYPHEIKEEALLD